MGVAFQDAENIATFRPVDRKALSWFQRFLTEHPSRGRALSAAFVSLSMAATIITFFRYDRRSFPVGRTNLWLRSCRILTLQRRAADCVPRARKIPGAKAMPISIGGNWAP